MNVKLLSTDDENTIKMNVWMSVYLEGGCTPSALEKADLALKEFDKRFLSTESSYYYDEFGRVIR